MSYKSEKNPKSEIFRLGSYGRNHILKISETYFFLHLWLQSLLADQPNINQSDCLSQSIQTVNPK